MSKKLIIAEKPNLAKNISNAIQEQFDNKFGYKESNNFIVSWGYGHLFELVDMSVYTGEKKWKLENIPFLPEKFKWRLKDDKGVKEQFAVLQKLLNREDVDTIIHCGDADREGEVIVRMIIKQGLNDKSKSIKRLWLPEQTDKTIRKALDNLVEDSDYDNLYREGVLRTYIDWLYGINLTRYVTLKSGTLFKIGRVVTPIVKEIYNREIAIKDFVPTKYYKAESKCNINDVDFTLSDKAEFSIDERDKAMELCDKYNKAIATVVEVENKQTEKKSGKLFSLSKLQGLLGKNFKMPLKHSMKIIQELYEQGYITYPRTNTEYLSENEKSKVVDVINALKEAGFEKLQFKDSKRIFDDSKIESHSAIIPTYKIPKELSSEQQKVYDTIRNRFLAVFCSEDCLLHKTIATIRIAETDFTLTGIAIMQRGWLEYEPVKITDKVIPCFHKGDTFKAIFEVVEKETTPPKRYTTASFSEFLRNPFKKDTSTVDEEYKAILSGIEIGTEATRTNIIDYKVSSSNAQKILY